MLRSVMFLHAGAPAIDDDKALPEDDEGDTVPKEDPCERLSFEVALHEEARLPLPVRRSMREQKPSRRVVEQAATLQSEEEQRALKRMRRSKPVIRRIVEERVFRGVKFFKIEWKVTISQVQNMHVKCYRGTHT